MSKKKKQTLWSHCRASFFWKSSGHCGRALRALRFGCVSPSRAERGSGLRPPLAGNFYNETEWFQTSFQWRKKKEAEGIQIRKFWLNSSHNQHFATQSCLLQKNLFLSTRKKKVFLTNKQRRKNVGCATFLFFHFYISPSPKPPSPREGGFMEQKNEVLDILELFFKNRIWIFRGDLGGR